MLSRRECLERISRYRWPGGPRCPHCGAMPVRESGRNTRSGRFACGRCGRRSSLLHGTIFHGSRVGVEVWFFILQEMQRGVALKTICDRINTDLGVRLSYAGTVSIAGRIRRSPECASIAAELRQERERAAERAEAGRRRLQAWYASRIQWPAADSRQRIAQERHDAQI